jgi:hypothetical protein
MTIVEQGSFKNYFIQVVNTISDIAALMKIHALCLPEMSLPLSAKWRINCTPRDVFSVVATSVVVVRFVAVKSWFPSLKKYLMLLVFSTSNNK